MRLVGRWTPTLFPALLLVVIGLRPASAIAQLPPLRLGHETSSPLPKSPAAPVVSASFVDASADGPLTQEKIAAEVAAIEALTNIDPEAKKEHLARLTKATEWLQQEQDTIRRLGEFSTQLAAIPETLKAVQAELAKPSVQSSVELPQGATVAQLETRLAEFRHQVEIEEAAFHAKELEAENRPKRLAEISKEILDVEKRIADANTVLLTLTGVDLLSKTKQYEQKARLRARQQQLTTLKTEQQRLEAVTELLPMQRDMAKRAWTNTNKTLQLWQSAVDAWRKEESARQAAEARLVAENSHPALKALATQNADIAELRIKTAASIESLAKSVKEIKDSSKQYAEAFEDLKHKVEHAGATSSTGVLLVKQRDELPHESSFVKRRKFVQEQTPQAHLKLMELNQLRREMADPAEMAIEMLGSFQQSLAGFDQQSVLDALTRLLTDRRDFLDKASVDQNTYLQDLNELELANQSLEEQVASFRLYLNQRVMWIRSAEPFGFDDVRATLKGAAIVLRPSLWMEVVRVGGGEFLRRPAGGIAVISLFLLILLGRARLLNHQEKLCEPKAVETVASFWQNVSALVIAVILSAQWPVLLMAIGYRLKVANGSTPWTQAVGEACLMTVILLWGCELVREICRRGGIGEKLFHWPTNATSSVRNTLELTLFVSAPLLAFLQVSRFGEPHELMGLERTLFISTLTLCSLQLGILTRPTGRLMQSIADLHPTGGLVSLRSPIWFVATFAPLALALLSLAGYHFSAYQLSARLAETGAAVVGVILLHSMLLSWLDVNTHNRLAKDGLMDPSPEIALQAASRIELADDSEDSEEATRVVSAKPGRDAHREFRDLLRYAAVITLACAGWFIWAEVLPAIRILDRVTLWHNMTSAAETVTSPDGTESIQMVDHTVPTTLTDILLAMLVAVAAVLIGKRLPGLLELTILERLPLDHGGKQAIAILTRYAATFAGLLIACHFIRVSWSSVQWLAAAMTVGLGFGLQEIFANLVSGLIILFERPIRTGDLVTVGDVTGSVTRMQMRATTITDFDRREMIVPNKTFITDNVINWTLSDPISRVVLPVGVAYGTDVTRTQGILMRIARRSAFVLNEPAPSTLFKGFGDSTLNLELRVFIPNREMYMNVMNELNNAIVREFAKAKIEIAFPQRDIHLRGLEAFSPWMSKISESLGDEPRARSA